mgnify:CR=1 FL=1|jgi:hypothetical protein
MKDFIEKPITAEVRALVHEIVDRFLDYNPTRTNQETTGDKPTFFIDLSGHLCTLEVSAHANGYSNNSECEHITDFAGVDLYEEDTLTQLQGVLNRMDEIYKDWEKKEHCNE